MNNLTHFDKIEYAIGGIESTSVPVAFWKHFPIDDQKPETLAKATYEFQKQFDFDFVKISPPSSFCLKGWGIIDEWRGHPEGVREYTHYPFSNPDYILDILPLDPTSDSLGNQLTCCRMLRKIIDSSTPLLQTVFSPLSQLKNLVGKEKITGFIRRYPDLVMHALRVITQTTLEWIHELYTTKVDGIFYAAQLADYSSLTTDEYQMYGRPFDLQILNACHDFQLILLHIHGSDVMFDEFIDYPVAIFNWDQSIAGVDLKAAGERTRAVLCGGLKRMDEMLLGDANVIKNAFSKAIEQTNGSRFILGADCVLMQATPIGNIFTAIQMARNQTV